MVLTATPCMYCVYVSVYVPPECQCTRGSITMAPVSRVTVIMAIKKFEKQIIMVIKIFISFMVSGTGARSIPEAELNTFN